MHKLQFFIIGIAMIGFCSTSAYCADKPAKEDAQRTYRESVLCIKALQTDIDSLVAEQASYIKKANEALKQIKEYEAQSKAETKGVK